MLKQRGRVKGSGTVERSKRIYDLPVVLEDLACHLGFYDFQNQPSMDEVDEDDIKDDLLEFKKQLEKMISMESFITLFKIQQQYLFEKNRDLEEDPTVDYRRTKLEQFFMNFNDVLEFGDPRNFLPWRVQFGADLELMLQLMEPFFRFHGKSIRELKHRGVPSSNIQQKRTWPKIHRFDLFLDEPPQQELNPKEKHALFGNKPITTKYKNNRFYFSLRLRELLKQDAHLKQVRVINANARDRHKRACDYIASLFKKYNDLTFVSLDLCFDQRSSMLNLSNQLKEFKKKARKCEELPPMVGYIGKWEYTPIKGKYVRIVCIFEKQEKHVVALLPTVIGAFWVDDITHGKGKYHVAKLSSDWTIFNGSVGTISASDSSVRKQFERRIVLYLTHSQEYFRYKFNRNFDLDLKAREIEREKGRQLSSDEGLGEKVGRKSRKISGRYTALTGSDEPHDIFFRGEVVVKNKKKPIVKNSTSKQDQEIVNLGVDTDLEVELDVVATVTEYSAEPSVDTSLEKVQAIAVPVKQNRRYITVIKANSREK